MSKIEIEYVTIACATPDCGLDIAMSKEVNERFRKNHRVFYCLNGHNNYYPQRTDEDVLRSQLREARQRIELLENPPPRRRRKKTQ